MTTQTEALKHLKAITEAFGPDAGIELDQKAWAKLHAAIKEALAQPAVSETHKQEPVAHSVVEPLRPDEYQRRVSVKWVNQPVAGPLYTTPPQRTWVGLTDEEIKLMDVGFTSNASFYAGAVWAEAKLKERNNA